MIIKEKIAMDLNLRHAVIANVSGNDQEQIEHTIVDAIQSGEEKMLPGLGVLFEVLWEHSSDSDKHEMLAQK
jgi:small acid-soluble spore protein I (minor)